MEPTEQTTDRRAEFVTRAIACLAGCGMALYMLNGQMAAIMFALSFIVLLCHVCGVNPFHLMWRMVRKAVGHRFDTRFTWGELNIHRPRFDIGLRLSSRGDDDGSREPDMLIVHGIVFGLYLHLPTYICARFKAGDRHRWDDGAEFGFYTIDTSIVWKWKQSYTSWQFPFFSYEHLSTEVLSIDGKKTLWKEFAKNRRKGAPTTIFPFADRDKAQCASCEVHPYTYTRRNGEVQHRMATVYVERMTHTRKWFPFLKSVRTSIWVSFNEEIGEEVGSWKGGTTGCGWNMLAGETALDCLRRMEADRFFEKGRHRTRNEEKKSTTRGFLARIFLP